MYRPDLAISLASPACELISVKGHGVIVGITRVRVHDPQYARIFPRGPVCLALVCNDEIPTSNGSRQIRRRLLRCVHSGGRVCFNTVGARARLRHRRYQKAATWNSEEVQTTEPPQDEITIPARTRAKRVGTSIHEMSGSTHYSTVQKPPVPPLSCGHLDPVAKADPLILIEPDVGGRGEVSEIGCDDDGCVSLTGRDQLFFVSYAECVPAMRYEPRRDDTRAIYFVRSEKLFPTFSDICSYVSSDLSTESRELEPECSCLLVTIPPRRLFCTY